MGEGEYISCVRDLQLYLAGYFESSGGCSLKLGKSGSPIGSTAAGGKKLKVRWAYPGCGKSGGLRMCFVAFCEMRKVVLCHIAMRRDVDEDVLESSGDEADAYVVDGAWSEEDSSG
jgi:hypothetical protein